MYRATQIDMAQIICSQTNLIRNIGGSYWNLRHIFFFLLDTSVPWKIRALWQFWDVHIAAEYGCQTYIWALNAVIFITGLAVYENWQLRSITELTFVFFWIHNHTFDEHLLCEKNRESYRATYIQRQPCFVFMCGSGNIKK